MNILFIMKYPLESGYNLKHKFDGQINAVRNLGHNVYYIAWDNNGMYLIGSNEKILLKKISGAEKPSYIHSRAFWDLYKSVTIAVKHVRFDVAYIRKMPFDSFGYKMLKCLKNNKITIVEEIPTFPSEREKASSLKLKLAFLYLNIWKKACDKCIDIYTLIGEDAGGKYNGKVAINIDNGVDLGQLVLRQPQYDSDTVHILALASMSYWQAYDRLIIGTAHYNGNIPFKIHMVGNESDGSLRKWQQLVTDMKLEDHVVFDGYMTGKELDNMFDQCSIGVGTLGMFRKNFTSGSILKIREYTARGLPFVYAADDPAITDECDFCMKITNDDTPVDIDKVLDFALKMRQDHSCVKRMRKYAEINMGWEKQMRKVFDVIKERD